MMKEVFDIFLDSLYEQIEYKHDLEQILRTIIEYTFNFLDEHREMTNLIINRPGTVDEDIQTWLSSQKQKIVQFLARIIRIIQVMVIDVLILQSQLIVFWEL